MKTASALLLTMWLALSSYAADLTTATVVSVKKYDRGRIAYWEGYVPIYDENPVYDITIQIGKKQHIARYESLTGFYPRAWNVGSEIQVRRKRGGFVLMNGKEEVPARSVSRNDCVMPSRPNLGLPCQ